MTEEKKLTFEEILSQQEEVVRRGKIIQERLKRLEFSAPGSEAVTGVAALYAVIIQLAITGVPLHVVIRVVATIYALAEEVLLEDVWERVRRELLMNLPTGEQKH